MSSFFAFLHHVAAFALVAGIVVELVLVREPLTVANARRVLRADMAVGIAAGAILAIGILRVLYFEKDATYYLHSAPFIAKMALFALIAVMSIYPTLTFLFWRGALAGGSIPDPDENRLRTLRKILHWELVLLIPLLLCAALMARGVAVF
jgi:putative membrane protein